MRKLRERDSAHVLSLEVVSVLQLYTTGELLFPNLKTFDFRSIAREFIPFIPLFLSPRTTEIDIALVKAESRHWGPGDKILRKKSDPPGAVVASMITALPKLCPNLEHICLESLRSDPSITAAVSAMILATNINTLRSTYLDSELTEEARKVVSKLRAHARSYCSSYLP